MKKSVSLIFGIVLGVIGTLVVMSVDFSPEYQSDDIGVLKTGDKLTINQAADYYKKYIDKGIKESTYRNGGFTWGNIDDRDKLRYIDLDAYVLNKLKDKRESIGGKGYEEISLRLYVGIDRNDEYFYLVGEKPLGKIPAKGNVFDVIKIGKSPTCPIECDANTAHDTPPW